MVKIEGEVPQTWKVLNAEIVIVSACCWLLWRFGKNQTCDQCILLIPCSYVFICFFKSLCIEALLLLYLEDKQTEAWKTRFQLFMPIPVTVLLVLSSVIKVLLFFWWICQEQTVSFLLILYKPAPFSRFFLSVSLLSENFLTSLNGSMSLWARSWCFHKRAPLWKLWVAVVDICRRETSRTET